MKDVFSGCFGLLLFAALVGVIAFAFCLGRAAGIQKVKDEAVKVGHAYYFTTESGEQIWRWKD